METLTSSFFLSAEDPSTEHPYAAVKACVLTATTAMWVANINKERDGERSAPSVVRDLFVLFCKIGTNKLPGVFGTIKLPERQINRSSDKKRGKY